MVVLILTIMMMYIMILQFDFTLKVIELCYKILTNLINVLQ
jgi:hypothetical protein